jgi:hypothetical protein
MFLRVFIIRGAFIGLWLLAIGAGFWWVLKYQNTNGPTGLTPEHWPAKTSLAHDPKRDTLVMFVHPQCPCTQASMEELNRLLAHAGDKVAAQILFFRPGQFTEQWTHAALWHSASAIPGVTVADDADGTQAHLFGADTSGYVLLYDTDGQLLFKGGITGSRGHAGDNAGEAAIVALLNGQTASVKQTPVYGCSLSGKCEASQEIVAK